MECRIILVDDHSLFRNGLRGLLERNEGFRVVGEASSGEEFLSLLEQESFAADIVFMDFSMPGLDGAQTTERALARRPDLRIITLSMFGEESYYSRMVEAGARGFLLKDSDIGDVLEAIAAVMGGGSYFSPRLLSSISSRRASGRSWWPSAGDSRIRRSPMNSSFRNVRWTSTAPTSSRRPVARIRPASWSMPSATASSISDRRAASAVPPSSVSFAGPAGFPDTSPADRWHGVV